MGLAFILLALGALLLCAEMFMPGFGICGISGIVIIIISAIVAFLSGPLGAYVVLSEIVLLTVFVIVVVNYVKKRQLNKLVLEDTLESAEHENLDGLIGKQGIVVTSLRPVGLVDFNGMVLESYSECGFIEKDRYITVTRVDRRKIYVKTLN